MKILIVHYRYFITGGPERYLFNLKDALEKKGHTVIPFSLKNSHNQISEYSDFFIENIGGSDEIFIDKYPKTLNSYLDLISREFYSFKVKKKLKELINITRPDICYMLVYKRALSPSVIDACREMRVPIVNRISDYNPVCGTASLYRKGSFCKECFTNGDWGCVKHCCIKQNLMYSFMRWLSMQLHRLIRVNKKINAFVCTNGFMKEMLLERKVTELNKINIIPTFFHETSVFHSIDKRQRKDSKLKLLYIGNIDHSKGIYDLLMALKIVSQKYRNFHLTIVGGLHDDENQRMLRLLEEYKIADFVTFFPFRKDGRVYNYYLDANVTVIPARWVENLPNTLIESLYFCRPVIVPLWGSFKYTTDKSVAFYYSALSAESLASTIINILLSPDLLEDKSRNCEVFFKTHYSESKHMELLINLFNKVINENN